MSVIEEYLTELDGRLYGQVRKKVDLLAEARDSLADAAEAYRLAGHPDAERRAVAEFGDVRLIAREYQAELGVASGIHALHMMMLTLPAMQGLFNLTRMISFGDWSQLTTAVPAWYPYVAKIHEASCLGVAVLGALSLVALRFLARWTDSMRIARFAATVAAVGVGTHFLALVALLGATDLVDARRLFLNVPCGMVMLLFAAVSVRLVVLTRRTWRSCATVAA